MQRLSDGISRTIHKTADDYEHMKWQNGKGVTKQIHIEPEYAQFPGDEFIWRLSSATINGPCDFSRQSEGVQRTLIVLPCQDKDAKQVTLKIKHPDSTAKTLKPLVPYTYVASMETSAVPSKPLSDLTLMVDTDRCKAETSVESLDADGEFRRLVLGTWCILYGIEGSASFTVEGDSGIRKSGGVEENITTKGTWLQAGESILFNRGQNSSPKYLKAHVNRSDSDEPVKEECVFVLIQIHDITKQQHTPKLAQKLSRTTSTTNVPDAPAVHTRKQTTKQASVVYDDQPIWAQSQDVFNQIKSNKLTVPETMASKFIQSTPHQIYQPPDWASLDVSDSKVSEPIEMDSLVLDDCKPGEMTTVWVRMVKQGLSDWIKVPCIVARGSVVQDAEEGETDLSPCELVVGITAALHGNELNGISCIHRLVSELDVKQLVGTVVFVPCLNVPGYLGFKREFSDGKDLNRLFPGASTGTASQVYAHAIMTKIVNNFTHLIDLHTASFGRVNSYYVRADMNDEVSSKLARLQQPQIILHNSGQDGTMRSAASSRKIKSVTVEIGNPQQFQNQFIMWAFQGLLNTLEYLGMYDNQDTQDGVVEAKRKVETLTLQEPWTDPSQQFRLLAPHDSNAILELSDQQPFPAVICSKGFWTYTNTGGVLEVYVSVNSYVQKGMLVARIKDIWGRVVDENFAPCDAMVIGRSSNPVAMAGDRIIHYGVIQKKGEVLPHQAKENY